MVDQRAPVLPSGLVTFLFTDIEGSTERWEREPEAMARALERHNVSVGAAIEDHRGHVFKHTGDGVAAVFSSPSDAVAGAIDAQRRLQSEPSNGLGRLRIRMGMHAGEASPTGDDYYGPTVNRAARVMDIANGDQITVSSGAAVLLEDVELRPMGLHQLRGIGTDEVHVVSAPGLMIDERPLRARACLPTRQLPPARSRLVGRDAELDELAALVDGDRAITIVGPGGVGKTSLALEVGRRSVDRFTDGVVFCDLTPIDDVADVADAVAGALGARVQPGMSLLESIVDFVDDRRLLLVLDNCEHVAATAQTLGDAIVGAGVTILATSRGPIGWSTEHLFPLDPLSPASGVELFVERARDRDRSFEPTSADRDQIAEICQRVDGLPLAIELAAPWTRILSTGELTERLDDRFRVLRGDDVDPRHRTLWDTVHWSYEQLDRREARLFDQLSVFGGGFSLEAVESVCADPDGEAGESLEILMALVEKSMVRTQRGTGHIRFSMLSTLRHFGREQLAASSLGPETELRHAAYFIELARTNADLLISAKEAEVWELLDREWANLRTAFDTLIEHEQLTDAADLVVLLGWFATFSMRFEAFAWVDRLFAHDLDDAPQLGSLYGLRALGQYFTAGDRAVELARRGLEIDDRDPHGFCRGALAAVSLNNVHTAEESEHLTTTWLEHLSADAPLSDRLWAEGMRTFHLCTHRPSPEAAAHAEELMRLATGSESATAMALARWAGGMVASFEGTEQAMEQWRLGLDSARSLDAGHLLIPLIIGLQLHFTAGRGDLDAVVEHNLQALEDAHEQHYLAGTSHLFGVTAIVLCRAGRAEVGGRLLGAMSANGHLPRGNARRAVEKALGDATADVMASGSGLSIDDAAKLAIGTLRSVELDTNPGG